MLSKPTHWPLKSTPSRPGAAATIAAVRVRHPENFPVASLLCPPALRAPIRAIYHFARTADDIADEGDASPAKRRATLLAYRESLYRAAHGEPPSRWSGVFRPLATTIRRHNLPLRLLDDLLDAFIHDTANPRYDNREQLLAYCAKSANPVGRLLLRLHGVDDELSIRQSDSICSALQLINFWQDPSVDIPRGRHYVPLADAQRHGLTLDSLSSSGDTPATQALLRDLVAWAAGLMVEGAPLALRVPGRMGWELRLVVQGGLRMLERIAAMNYSTLQRRPALRVSDATPMLWRAFRMRPDRIAAGMSLA